MNRIAEYSLSIHSALLRDLSETQVPEGPWSKAHSRRPSEFEIAVFSRDEVWPNTATAFNLSPGGLAGQAFTTALTVVVICYSEVCVYVGGHIAYTLRAKSNEQAREFFQTLYSADRVPHQRGAVDLFPHGVWIGGREITYPVLNEIDAEHEKAEREFLKEWQREQREAAKKPKEPKRPHLMLGVGHTIELPDDEADQEAAQGSMRHDNEEDDQ